VLASHGELTITNLAMLSKTNHKRCGALLKWLEDSGLVEFHPLKNKQFIALTPAGLEYARHVVEVAELARHP
jgi:predicted transcriptional regulator